jgi:transposase-like protein
MHGEFWTDTLDAKIVSLRRDQKLTAPQIAVIVDRKPGAVYARFRKLDALLFVRREWTEAETRELIKLVDAGEMTIRAIGEHFGRNENSVRWKLDDLGIKPNRRPDWTEDQLARLHKAFADNPSVDNATLATLVGRPESSVSAKVVQLGLRPNRTWTDDHVAKLRSAGSAEEAAALTGRDLGSVRAKAYALGIRFPNSVDMAWTDELDAKLTALISARGTGDNALMSMEGELGHNARGIRKRAVKLGLMEVGKPRGRPLDAAARAEIVQAAKNGMTITQAAKALRRDNRNLRKVAAEEGVAFAIAPRVVKAPAKPKIPALPKQMTHKPVFPAIAKPAAPTRTAREAKAELVRLAAESTVPVLRIEAAPPKAKRPAIAKAAPAKPQVTKLAVVRQVAPASPPRVKLPIGMTIEEAIDLVRGHGFKVSRMGGGFVINGRQHLANQAALLAFIDERGLRLRHALQAAE